MKYGTWYPKTHAADIGRNYPSDCFKKINCSRTGHAISFVSKWKQQSNFAEVSLPAALSS